MKKIAVRRSESAWAQAVLGLFVAMALGACGGGTADDGTTGDGTGDGENGAVEVTMVSTSTLNLGSGRIRMAANPLNLWNPTGSLNLLADGDATPLLTGATDGLMSYKVYFRSIQVCESVESNGTGYSNAMGCATLYDNSEDAYTGTEEPTAEQMAIFEAAGEGKYYDLLSDTDMAALKAAMATSIASGEYNYGIIETHPWVKIKAKSGSTCTHSGGTFVAGGTYNSYIEADLDCGVGVAEETVAYMRNGNMLFNFAEPMTVGADPVRADVLFNLDRLVTKTNGSGQLRNEDGSAGFSVPFFSATPVVISAGDTITKETYELVTNSFAPDMGGTATATIRVDLYYPTSDATRAPIGVTAAFIRTDVGSNTEEFSSVSVDEEGTVLLGDFEGKVTVSFARTIEGVESTGTADCRPTVGGYLAGCPMLASGEKLFTLTDSDGPTITVIE